MLTADDDDAADEGRTLMLAVSDRAPFWTDEVEVVGESCEEAKERSLAREPRCCAVGVFVVAYAAVVDQGKYSDVR